MCHFELTQRKTSLGCPFPGLQLWWM